MNFESFDNLDLERKSRIERYKRKIKRIAKIGLIVATVGLGGYLAKEVHENREDYKKYYETTPDEEKKKYEALRNVLIEEIGEKNVERMEAADRVGFWERESGENGSPEINGFERIGISDEVLGKIWSDGNGAYPKKWISGEISRIYFLDREEKLSGKYGEKLAKHQADAATSNTGEVIFYKNKILSNNIPKESLLENIDGSFGHEMGHQNDWETDKDLSLLERAELLKAIIDRMNSDRPFRSIMEEFYGSQSYHGSIINEDKKAERYLKAKEYWAQVCEDYFAVPTWLEDNYTEDYRIVDSYIKKVDNSFDPVRAENQRDQIMKEGVN